MNDQLKIVFMGTPDFAVPSLDILQQNLNVVAVITAPDKPAGRGKKLRKSPVKEFAESKQIPVLQPPNLKDPAFLTELKSYEADLQVVVAFRMLPEVVWNMPPKGTINLHGSLLPHYRGAAPINWAIINGEKETGVTTFFLQHEIDTGDLIDQRRIRITPEMTAGELHYEMMQIGAEALLDTVQKVQSGTAKGTPQQTDEANLMKAPKIFKEDCQINWSRPSEEVHNLIRGLSPYPAAWTKLSDDEKPLTFKILRSRIAEPKPSAPGKINAENGSQLFVGTSDGRIEILELQMEGKKKMTTDAFLRGFTFPENATFSS